MTGRTGGFQRPEHVRVILIRANKSRIGSLEWSDDDYDVRVGAADAAIHRLARTVPTTTAGGLAFITYFQTNLDAFGMEDGEGRLVEENILASLKSFLQNSSERTS